MISIDGSMEVFEKKRREEERERRRKRVREEEGISEGNFGRSHTLVLFSQHLITW